MINREWYLKKIPKVAYTYWGAETMPYLRYMSLYSFCKYNPDWELNLYIPFQFTEAITWSTGEASFINDKDNNYWEEALKLPVKILGLNMNKFNLSNTIPEVHKSNILQAYVLSTLGGAWVDIDILFYKSLSDLYFNTPENKPLDNTLCISRGFHSPAFELSCPNNQFHSYLFKKAFKSGNPLDYQGYAASLRNDEFPTTTQVERQFPKLQTINMSLETVFSYFDENMDKIWDEKTTSRLTDNSIGIHWYGGNPTSVYWVKKIKHNTFVQWDNSICRLLKIIHNYRGDK